MRYITADRIYTLSKEEANDQKIQYSSTIDSKPESKLTGSKEEKDPLQQGTLVVNDKGAIEDILPFRVSREDLEIYPGAICPGFINCHTHLELSHLKGLIPEHTGLVDFILQVQKARGAGAEIIQEAIQKAYQEMVEEGIVGFGDISNSVDSFSCKTIPFPNSGYVSSLEKGPDFEPFPQEKGFQGNFLELYEDPGRLHSGNQAIDQILRSHTFIECFGFNPDRAQETLQRAYDLKKEAERLGLSTSITPHAPYSVSKKLFDLIKQAEKGFISIHNQETAAEDQFYKTGNGEFRRLYETFGIDISFFKAYGKNSLETYFPWLGPQKKLLVHNTVTDVQNAREFDSENTYWCLCPGANLFIENRLPGIPGFESFSGKIVLGTDSLASNHRLSILSEMKYIQEEFSQYNLHQLLIWACRNGAEFFDWTELGSIEIGKKPGLLLLEGLGEGDRILDKTSVRRII